MRTIKGVSRRRLPRVTAPFTLLSALRPGADGIVARIDDRPNAMLPLLELGLAVGERVRLVRTAPLGDPLEVELMGYRLAIRRSEAEGIVVRVNRDTRHGR